MTPLRKIIGDIPDAWLDELIEKIEKALPWIAVPAGLVLIGIAVKVIWRTA